MLKKTRQQSTERKRLDIRDVARHAGVSIATVSRTINAVPTVDRELAARVQRSIRELNYFPNTQARSLVSGRSRLLGLLISEITNPFFPELIQGFEDAAIEHTYELLIGSTNYDTRRMEACIRRMVERDVEGVAVMTFGIEGPLLDELSRAIFPWSLSICRCMSGGPKRCWSIMTRASARRSLTSPSMAIERSPLSPGQ